MSKLRENIKSVQSRNRMAEISSPLLEITEDINALTGQYLIEYNIGVKLGHSVWCRDGKEVEYQKQRVADDIIQFVFGEFRDDFVNINCAIYERDLDKVRELIYSLQKKMFD